MDKKLGRFSGNMPMRLIRVRFLYATDKAPTPIYGEWMDLTSVYGPGMFANPEYQVLKIEFENREVK